LLAQLNVRGHVKARKVRLLLFVVDMLRSVNICFVQPAAQTPIAYPARSSLEPPPPWFSFTIMLGNPFGLAGSICYCAPQLQSVFSNTKLPSMSCATACAGEPETLCGGVAAMSIYLQGLWPHRSNVPYSHEESTLPAW